jgi:hypothetical protein
MMSFQMVDMTLNIRDGDDGDDVSRTIVLARLSPTPSPEVQPLDEQIIRVKKTSIL